MPRKSLVTILSILGLMVAITRADTVSYTGSLLSPEDSTSGQIVITVPVAGTVDLQTWSFGGGTNAAGASIPAGGFDPFVGVFQGTGDSALFINGTSDVLGGFAGCPPAGEVNIGGLVCGDIKMDLSLAAGTYTVLLTDGNYIPNAVFETAGMLGDPFTDLTGGAFQTCNLVGSTTTCATDTANWAIDITTPSGVAAVPEPGALPVSAIVFLALAAAYWRRRRILASAKHSAS
jgi:hypothetical protein